MKQRIVLTFSVIMLILTVSFFVSGQNETEIKELEAKAGITPNSFLWNLERLSEDIRLFFTFNNTEKAELRLQFAEERLAEMSIMLAKENIKAAEKAEEARSKEIEEIENLEIDNKTKAEIIANLQKHLSVLQEVLENAPEQAKKGLENGINQSSNLIERFEVKQNASEEKPKQEKPLEISYITNASNITCGYCQYLVNNLCLDYGCCNNSKCRDEESCYEHECRVLECGTCQYIENHRCMNYECCEDSGCSESKICVNHSCESLSCSTCQHAENHECINYECCKNEDCNTGEICSANNCINKPTGDITPPTITITSPENGANVTTTSVWFNVITDENAVCKYAKSESISFPCPPCDSGACGGCGGGGGGSAPRNMSQTGGTEHSQLIENLKDTASYSISVNCTDTSGNSNKKSVSFVASLNK